MFILIKMFILIQFWSRICSEMVLAHPVFLWFKVGKPHAQGFGLDFGGILGSTRLLGVLEMNLRARSAKISGFRRAKSTFSIGRESCCLLNFTDNFQKYLSRACVIRF